MSKKKVRSQIHAVNLKNSLMSDNSPELPTSFPTTVVWSSEKTDRVTFQTIGSGVGQHFQTVENLSLTPLNIQTSTQLYENHSVTSESIFNTRPSFPGSFHDPKQQNRKHQSSFTNRHRKFRLNQWTQKSFSLSLVLANISFQYKLLCFHRSSRFPINLARLNQCQNAAPSCFYSSPESPQRSQYFFFFFAFVTIAN